MSDDSYLDLERLLPAAIAIAFRAQVFDTLFSWVQDSLRDYLRPGSPAHGDAQFARNGAVRAVIRWRRAT